MALTWHWSLWEDDGRGGQLHEDDLATGRQWTRETALRQAELAQEAGAEVFALLINHQRQVAYFVRDGRVHRVMLVEGRPWMNDAIPVEPHRPPVDRARVDWLAQQFDVGS
jgi:hypothetical protein